MLNKIPQSHYSRKYYLSPQHDYLSLEIYEKFLKGDHPPKIFLDAINQIVLNNKSVFLDIGCGRGELAIYLARLGFRVFSIDYATAAIKIATTNLKNENLQVKRLVTFEKSNCTKLPYASSKFTNIFMMDIIEHLTDIQLIQAFNEVHRVMKDQGKLLIHTNNKYFEKFSKYLLIFSYHGWKYLLNPTYYQAKYRNPYEYMHINYKSATELKQILTEIGFQVEIKYIYPKTFTEVSQYIINKHSLIKNLTVFIGWILLQTPLKRYLTSTYWIIASKI